MGDDDTQARHTQPDNRRRPPDMPRYAPGAFERTLRRAAAKPPPPQPRVPEELKRTLTRVQWWELGLPTRTVEPKPAYVTLACGRRELYTLQPPLVGHAPWHGACEEFCEVTKVEPANPRRRGGEP